MSRPRVPSLSVKLSYVFDVELSERCSDPIDDEFRVRLRRRGTVDWVCSVDCKPASGWCESTRGTRRFALTLLSFRALSIAVRASSVRRLRSSASKATEKDVVKRIPRRAWSAALDGTGFAPAIAKATRLLRSGAQLLSRKSLPVQHGARAFVLPSRRSRKEAIGLLCFWELCMQLASRMIPSK